MRNRTLLVGLALGATLAVGSGQARAQFTAGQIPVDGPLNAAFVDINSFIKDHMVANQISAMTVAIMWNGRVVFERGYGWKDYYSGDPTPVINDDVARVASVTKPMVGAIIVKLIADGVINGTDLVFDFGQTDPATGLLPAGTYFPYTGVLGDNRLLNITVNNLRRHRGGWDSGASFDPQFSATTISAALGNVPPGPIDTVKYMLAQPLQFTPGTNAGLCDGDFCYSNFGFMLLGLIIQQVTGQTPAEYLRDNFLPLWGGATDELFAGRTFKEDQDPREPYYYTGGALVTNVFFPTRGPAQVERPYGSWEHEVFLGHGDLVTNTTTMLHFADRYFTWYDASGAITGGTADIGTPLGQVGSWSGRIAHSGSISGSNAWHLQYFSGRRIAVIANRRAGSSDDTFVSDVADSIVALTNGVGFTYPTVFATDNWVDFAAGGGGDGSFDSPMSTVDAILPTAQDRGRVKFKPGNTNWTGTISKPIRLDAPLGTVRIGLQ